MNSLFSPKSHPLLLGTLALGGLIFLSNLSAKQIPVKASQAQAKVKVETLQFANVEELHNYNIHAFEQVRDKFGFSRVIKVYRNPMHHQNLIVGKDRVKSISLVSNALSKTLNVNTLEMQELPINFNFPTTSHPSFQVSFASSGEQEAIYQKLSSEKPMIKEGTKVWAAMFAKQQCLKCHDTYKLGSVIGAFVYDLEMSAPIQQEKQLKETKPGLIKEVTLSVPRISIGNLPVGG